MAFQITEWAATRSDLARERQIIKGFIADIERDRAEYSSSIASDEFRVSAANASLVGAGLPPIDFAWRRRETDLAEYSFEASKLAAENVKQLKRLWSDIVIGYHPTPSTSTYDTLVGAGEMKVIRDASVVREIQAYHNLQESVVTQTDKLLEIRRDVIGIGASNGLAPYVSVPSDEYFRKIRDNPELAAAIRIMATFVIFHQGELKTADAKAEQLSDALEAMIQ
ncbi:hypothetical protein [Congregibacter sp.]|uniref:hypothetical protein n=1 Tax=Congregibacter sp. TaxID=2744308 RepID=UPI003F6C42DE